MENFMNDNWMEKALINIDDGVVVSDNKNRVVFVNEAFEKLVEFPAEKLINHYIWQTFPLVKEDKKLSKEYYINNLAKKKAEAFEGEYRVYKKNKDLIVTLHLHFVDSKTIFLVKNVTAEKHNEIVQQRAAFLAEVSHVLSSTLDYETTLSTIAFLAVPTLADMCVVYMQEPDGFIRRLAIESVDSNVLKLTKKIQRQFVLNPKAKNGVPRVLRTGKSILYPLATPELLSSDVFEKEEMTKLFKDVKINSWICVPLSARGRTFGAISFITAKSKRIYSKEDLSLAEELGRRAAMSVDNAKLYKSAQEEIEYRKILEQKKDEFISVASHELKTPLTSIKAFTQILTQYLLNKADETGSSYLTRMTSQVNRLSNLVTDLLDVSRIQSGKIVFNNEVVDIDEVVDSIIEDLRPIAQRHQIVKQSSMSAMVECDRYRLEQVFINLITNAIKYSPSGKRIIVNITKKSREVIISVKDFGIGVPKEDQEKIFERFYRVEDKKRESYAGLGLGLYISAEIVKRHNGRIWVESKPGKGSTFYVALPILRSVNST